MSENIRQDFRAGMIVVKAEMMSQVGGIIVVMGGKTVVSWVRYSGQAGMTVA